MCYLLVCIPILIRCNYYLTALVYNTKRVMDE